VTLRSFIHYVSRLCFIPSPSLLPISKAIRNSEITLPLLFSKSLSSRAIRRRVPSIIMCRLAKRLAITWQDSFSIALSFTRLLSIFAKALQILLHINKTVFSHVASLLREPLNSSLVTLVCRRCFRLFLASSDKEALGGSLGELDRVVVDMALFSLVSLGRLFGRSSLELESELESESESESEL
jgi:hypothetical protein